MKLVGKKIASYVIDYVVVMGLATVYLFCANVFSLDPATQNQGILMLVCALLTTVLLTTYLPTRTNGQTLGQKLMQLRVVNDNGQPRTYMQSFLRECVVKISCAPIFVGITVVSMVLNLVVKRHLPQGRWLHDRLLKTELVRV